MITDLALPKPRQPASCCRARLRGLLPGEEVGEIQPQHADGAGAQQFPPGGPFAGVALASRNDEHGIAP